MTQANVEITRFNLYGWVAWLFLTLTVGSVAMIWTNPAFGVWNDYVQCFLWTFGISAAAQALSTLTVSSVTSALSNFLLRG